MKIIHHPLFFARKFIVNMRLDLFLKASRLIVRRTLAQEFCDAGKVKINNVKAKSSREVKVKDEIDIKRHNRLLKVRVALVPDKKQVSKQDAANLYEILSDEMLEDSIFGVEIGGSRNNPIK